MLFSIMKINDIKDDTILNMMKIIDISCNNTTNAGLHTQTKCVYYFENDSITLIILTIILIPKKKRFYK